MILLEGTTLRRKVNVKTTKLVLFSIQSYNNLINYFNFMKMDPPEQTVLPILYWKVKNDLQGNFTVNEFKWCNQAQIKRSHPS